MKKILITSIATLLISHATSLWARLREDKNQLETRYGSPVQTEISTTDDGKSVTVSRFEFKGFSIGVLISDDKSILEVYSKKDGSKLSEAEIQIFLQANSSGKEWEKDAKQSEDPDHSFWSLNDGSKKSPESIFAALRQPQLSIGTAFGIAMKLFKEIKSSQQKDTSGF